MALAGLFLVYRAVSASVARGDLGPEDLRDALAFLSWPTLLLLGVFMTVWTAVLLFWVTCLYAWLRRAVSVSETD